VRKLGKDTLEFVIDIAMYGSLLAAHIIAIIALFHYLKLFVFLLCMFVPVLGDIFAIYMLIKIQCYWPFILYAIPIFIGLIYSFATMPKQHKERRS